MVVRPQIKMLKATSGIFDFGEKTLNELNLNRLENE